MSKPLLIKICGMCTVDNILRVADTNIDLMGFIFYTGSPRYVGLDFQLPFLSPEKRKVGVFVSASAEEVVECSKRYCLHLVQLHGEESAQTAKKIYEQGISVMKAFSVDEHFDFESTRSYEPYCEYFLFDTKGQNRGGNGKRFDWDLLQNYRGATPFFLSGGIGLEHLEEVLALQHSGLAGIDLNSGVEDAPGIKNVDRINLLVSKIK